jgi:hypothetical protein
MLFSKKHIAKVLNKALSEGRSTLYPAYVHTQMDATSAETLISEARVCGFLDNNYRILREHRNLTFLTGIVEDAKSGDKVVVVKNGKSHEAVVSDDENGKFKLAFVDEAPDDHEEDKEYSNTDFGISDDEE